MRVRTVISVRKAWRFCEDLSRLKGLHDFAYVQAPLAKTFDLVVGFLQLVERPDSAHPDRKKGLSLFELGFLLCAFGGRRLGFDRAGGTSLCRHDDCSGGETRVSRKVIFRCDGWQPKLVLEFRPLFCIVFDESEEE